MYVACLWISLLLQPTIECVAKILKRLEGLVLLLELLVSTGLNDQRDSARALFILGNKVSSVSSAPSSPVMKGKPFLAKFGLCEFCVQNRSAPRIFWRFLNLF